MDPPLSPHHSGGIPLEFLPASHQEGWVPVSPSPHLWHTRSACQEQYISLNLHCNIGPLLFNSDHDPIHWSDGIHTICHMLRLCCLFAVWNVCAVSTKCILGEFVWSFSSWPFSSVSFSDCHVCIVQLVRMNIKGIPMTFYGHQWVAQDTSWLWFIKGNVCLMSVCARHEL